MLLFFDCLKSKGNKSILLCKHLCKSMHYRNSRFEFVSLVTSKSDLYLEISEGNQSYY